MDPSEKLTASWDSNAGNWTRAVRERLIPSRRAGTDEAVVAAILACEPKRVLDVGCGEGWLCRRIVQASGCEVLGIDGTQQLIDEARSADPSGRYELVTYRDLVAGTASLNAGFDVVVFNYALLDEDLEGLLAAVGRLLTGEGVVIIQTLHPWALAREGEYLDAWHSEDFAAFENERWAAMPWYFRRLSSWHEVIRSAGLWLERLEEPVARMGDLPLSLLMTCRREKAPQENNK